MKNTTYAYTYTVELSITHPTRELSYLAKELSAIPNGIVSKGIETKEELMSNISYDERKTSRISFEFDDGWKSAIIYEDLPTAIERIVDAVQPHKASLMEVVHDGGGLKM